MSELPVSEEHLHNGENGTLPVTRRLNSDRLQELLIQLKSRHLDLTGSIKNVVQLSGVHGGYSDMYYGLLPLSNPEGGIVQKKVAIKRLRVHIYTEQAFAKVCIFIEITVRSTFDSDIFWGS